MVDLPSAYTAARLRIAELVRVLDDGALDTPVPACPEWKVRDVVAHLVGVAADIGAGRNPDSPLDGAWTQAQVESRRGRSMADLLDEWELAAPAIVAAIAGGWIPFAFDVVVHEQDIRGALKRPGARKESVELLLEPAVSVMSRNIAAAGVPALMVVAGAQVLLAGDGEPAATVKVDRYELIRGAAGRRNERQLRAWEWTGDSSTYVPLLTFLPAATAEVLDD